MTEETCSFCGKAKREVGKLIAGPAAHICNRCIILCMQILEEEGGIDEEGGVPCVSEGQLLVRFPDGTVHTSDQEDAWRPFEHDGESLEWCPGTGYVRRGLAAPTLSWCARGARIHYSPRCGACQPVGPRLVGSGTALP